MHKAVVVPYQAQVRGPSGCARVLSQRNGFVQAVAGAWACGANFYWALWRCCRGCKLQSCQRAVSALDVDNVRCLPVPVLQACSVSVLVLAACALEGQNLELQLCLCPW